MPATWEGILAMFHDGTTKLPDRNQVAGASSKKWITKEVNGAWHSESPESKAKEWQLDGWYAFDFPARGDNRYLMFGFGYNWTDFGNDGGALSEFTSATEPILGSAVSGGNKDTNPLMSSLASDVFENMDIWTGGWVAQFHEWAEKVGNGSEELEGESAALFEAVLQGVKRSLLETQSFYMSGAIKDDLEAVSVQLTATLQVLQKNFWAWFGKEVTVESALDTSRLGSVSMAFPHLRAEFLKAIGARTFLSDHDPTVSGLDWSGIESAAKQRWLAEVETGLDLASAQTMVDLATAYDKASAKLSDANSIVKPTFTISLTPEEQKKFYGDAGTGGGPGGEGGADDFINKFKEMFGGGEGGGVGGAGAGGEGGGLGAGGGHTGLGGPPPITGPSGGISSTNVPKVPSLGAVPNPVTGSSGGISGGSNPPGGGGLPAGSRIDPRTGAVTDARGKPVLGTDGKPLIMPPGSTIGPGGKIISPVTGGPKPPTLPSGSLSGGSTRGFGIDAEGNLIVPKGTKVDAQGNLIGADGKPLTNMYGGKLSVPPGSRINADGTITDPQGKHVTESNNLKTRNPRTLDELLNGQRRPSTASGEFFGGSKNASEGLRKMVDSNGNPVREATSGVSGLSGRARAALGLPAVPSVAMPQGTVPTTQSIGALGRGGVGGGTGTGMPFMPPMGMGAGGAPGGGAGNGGERQRNVWLSEDEEVWGTEPDAGTGVIGR